jgi:hypothetical protein
VKDEQECNKRGKSACIQQKRWRLEEEGRRECDMTISKARWIYHCEIVKMDMKKEKRLDKTLTDE